MPRHTLTTTAAALTAAAALLLTACGNDDGTPSDNSKAASTESSSHAASSASPTANGPDLSLPKDLKLVFDFDKPSNADRAAALDDSANYIRALTHGITRQDPGDPAFQHYSAADAARYAHSQIESYVKGGWTITGTDRYYRAETGNAGGTKHVKLVRVSFCENQADAFGKEVKTGKIHYTRESLDSYLKFSILMASSNASPVWQAQSITVTGKAVECRQ